MRDFVLLYLQGLLLTLAVELPLAWALLRWRMRRGGGPVENLRIVAAVALGTLLTLPYLWFVYGELFSPTVAIACGETTAVLGEALVYRLIVGDSWGGSLLVSVAANLASVVVGLVLMPPF